MLWPIVLGTLLLASGFSALPVTPDEEILPSAEDESTLATDLVPPPVPTSEESGKTPVLFLINLYGVKNDTGDEEVLQDDILSEVSDISARLASILLVVEADKEDTPVNLEEVTKDLENEGFQVETIKGKDGKVKLIKVDIDLDDLESSELSEDEKKEDETEISRILRKKRETGEKGIQKIRMRRHLCLKCKLQELQQQKYGNNGYGNGGCGNGGCGGGYGQPSGNTIGVIPIAIVPVQGYQGGHQGGHHGGHHGGHQGGFQGGHQGCSTCGGGYQPPPPPPPQQPFCNSCGGGGYNQGGGGGYSQSSAQASASASAQSSSYNY